VETLKSHRADLDRGAEMLLSRETLSAEDFLPQSFGRAATGSG
jgi:hypothetical protein